ncbi:MAG TPA: spherulation-specific family 4 protein [Micromonosporaceae bacterium]
MTVPVDGRVRAVVPAYFHPAVDPDAWDRLVRCAPMLRLVVLNVADGPGERPDPMFVDAVRRLRQAGVVVAGYVDTEYGRRRTDDALADVERYLEWYTVTGVFFDQVSSVAEHVGYYAALGEWARGFGARVVAFNHGTHPVEAYAEHADLLGTFEGPWGAYVDVGVPRWVRARPAEQFYHLVYAVPPDHLGDAYALLALRHAGGAYITGLGGPNPWARLPDGLFERLAS